MKSNYIIRILIVIIAVVLIAVPESCKKKEYRIEKMIEGYWYAKEFTVNNINKLSEYYYYYSNTIYIGTSNYTGENIVSININHPYGRHIYGTWVITDNLYNLKISLDTISFSTPIYNDSLMPFRPNTITTWQIKKLKDANMILETDIEENHYYINLIK